MAWSEFLLKADINFSASGDTEIIAAPGAGKQIVIDYINFKLGSTASNIQLKDGTTNYGGPYNMAAYEGAEFSNNYQNQRGIITLSSNTAFKMNSTVSTQVSGFVRYRELLA